MRQLLLIYILCMLHFACTTDLNSHAQSFNQSAELDQSFTQIERFSYPQEFLEILDSMSSNRWTYEFLNQRHKQLIDSLLKGSNDTIVIDHVQNRDSIFFFNYKGQIQDSLFNYLELIDSESRRRIDFLNFKEGVFNAKMDSQNLSLVRYSSSTRIYDFIISEYSCTKVNYKDYMHPFFNEDNLRKKSKYKISKKGFQLIQTD